MPECIVGLVGCSHNPQGGQGWPALGAGAAAKSPQAPASSEPPGGRKFSAFFPEM